MRFESNFSARVCTTIVLAVMSFLAEPSHGLIVVDNSTTTSTAPGFAPVDLWNSTLTNSVYIGNLGTSDGWYLTASHVNAAADRLETLWDGDGTTMIDSDLAIYRGTDMGDVDFSLGCSAPSFGTDVLLIGDGVERQNSLTTWDSSWVESTDVGYSGTSEYTGYKWDSTTPKRWGTNQISSTSVTYSFDDPAMGPPADFTRGVEMVFDDDAPDASFESVPGSQEAQVSGGDSGGAAFAKTAAGDWELVGILSARSSIAGQPSSSAVFPAASAATQNNKTVFVDISHYCDQIMTITAVPEPSAALYLLLIFGAVWSGRVLCSG